MRRSSEDRRREQIDEDDDVVHPPAAVSATQTSHPIAHGAATAVVAMVLSRRVV